MLKALARFFRRLFKNRKYIREIHRTTVLLHALRASAKEWSATDARNISGLVSGITEGYKTIIAIYTNALDGSIINKSALLSSISRVKDCYDRIFSRIHYTKFFKDFFPKFRLTTHMYNLLEETHRREYNAPLIGNFTAPHSVKDLKEMEKELAKEGYAVAEDRDAPGELTVRSVGGVLITEK